ncbi:hypothetical protein L9F63_000955, partial [Diploptera punctata]
SGLHENDLQADSFSGLSLFICIEVPGVANYISNNKTYTLSSRTQLYNSFQQRSRRLNGTSAATHTQILTSSYQISLSLLSVLTHFH